MPVHSAVQGNFMSAVPTLDPARFQWEPIPTQHSDMNQSVIPLENPVSSAQFPQPLRIIVRRR